MIDNYFSWLAKKVYLYSVGNIVFLCGVLLLPILLNYFLKGDNQLATFAVSIFIMVFWKLIYESMVIYELSADELSSPMMAALAGATAGIATGILYFAKCWPLIDFWVPIPMNIILVILVPIIIDILRPLMYEKMEFAEASNFLRLPKKLKGSLLGFYLFVVLIWFFNVFFQAMDFGWFGALAMAFFVASLLEEIYAFLLVFSEKMTFKAFAWILVRSFIGGLFMYFISYIAIMLIKKIGLNPMIVAFIGIAAVYVLVRFHFLYKLRIDK